MSARHRGNSSCFVLVVLALAVVLGGALGTGLWRRAHRPTQASHNTLVWLRALPEDRLFYPDSAVLGQYGGDAYRNIGGGSNAWAGTYLGTGATKRQVFAFYDARLRPLGWVPARYRGQTSLEVEVAYWQRDDMLLEIGILRNSAPDARLPAGATDYAIAYTLELMYYGLPLPRPAP